MTEIGWAQIAVDTSQARYCLPRVGNVIDRYTRDYFRLFPSIADFDRAVVTCDASGTASFRITQSGKSDTTITLNQKTTIQLAGYLDQFENAQLDWYIDYPRVLAKQQRELCTSRIIDTGAVRIVQPRSMKLLTLHGETVQGVLLASTGDFLLVAENFDDAVEKHFPACRVLFKNEIIDVPSGALDAGKSFNKWFSSAFFAGFVLGSLVAGNIGGGSGHWGSDYMSAEETIYVGGAVGFVPGLLMGGMASLAAGSFPYICDTLRITGEKTESFAIPIAFPGMLPPESHRQFSDAQIRKDRDRNVLPSGADTIAALRREKNVTARGDGDPCPLSFAWTYGWNVYALQTREVSVWFGAELGKDWSLVSRSGGRPLLHLNTSAGIGLMFEEAQASFRFFVSNKTYLFLGLKYQHDYDTKLGSAYRGYLHSFRQNDLIGRNSFAITGIGWRNRDGFFELLGSFNLQPSVVSVREQPSLPDPYNQDPGPPYGITTSRFFSLSLRWGFDL
jgi:hypothetical protein